MCDLRLLCPDGQALSPHLKSHARHRTGTQRSQPKLRTITDAFLESRGIDVKVEPISILDEDFQKEVIKHDRNKTKAAEIEHAVRHHLDVSLNDDPELQASFAEALRQILEEFANNWKKIHEELEKLRQRIVNTSKEPTYGLNRKKQMPFFRMLKREIFGDVQPMQDVRMVSDVAPGDVQTEDEKIGKLVMLTQHLYLEIERELLLTGFWESIPARNKLKADLQKALLQSEFALWPKLVDNRLHIISRLMEIAEKNNDIIHYAD